jgi:hypothetical protein
MVAVKINFENVYDFDEVSPDLKIGTFQTELEDGTTIPLRVEIDTTPHKLLPDVYNLAFGPLNAEGEIDDKIQLQHDDYSKVFSTILFNALGYLTENPTHYLGIDGSDIRRAIMYYRFVKSNYEYLNEFFIIKGLKYYVRISRLGKHDYDDPFDFEDVFTYPHEILRNERMTVDKLYNYFIFTKKPEEEGQE